MVALVPLKEEIFYEAIPWTAAISPAKTLPACPIMICLFKLQCHALTLTFMSWFSMGQVEQLCLFANYLWSWLLDNAFILAWHSFSYFSYLILQLTQKFLIYYYCNRQLHKCGGRITSKIMLMDQPILHRSWVEWRLRLERLNLITLSVIISRHYRTKVKIARIHHHLPVVFQQILPYLLILMDLIFRFS